MAMSTGDLMHSKSSTVIHARNEPSIDVHWTRVSLVILGVRSTGECMHSPEHQMWTWFAMDIIN
jgi:hypothetical protein